MTNLDTLLADVRGRKSRLGIVTADRYFREVEGCFDGGFCPVKHIGADSQELWRKELEDAESRLTYTNKRTRVLRSTIKGAGSGGIMKFEAIVTTTLRDRDGDVLETKGAKVDQEMPLLWQHMAMSPIGRFVRVTRRTDSELRASFVLADTELARDAATLIKLKALRISHGFEPVEFEPMDDEKGWRFSKFGIFETSVVSIPSNVQAVITSVSKSKWASPLVKGWAELANPTVQAAVTENIHRSTETQQKMTQPDKASGTQADVPVDPKAGVPPWNLEDLQREYIAELAKADTETLRKASRQLSLMLRAAEDQDEARRREQEQQEWDRMLSPQS